MQESRAVEIGFNLVLQVMRELRHPARLLCSPISLLIAILVLAVVPVQAQTVVNIVSPGSLTAATGTTTPISATTWNLLSNGIFLSTGVTLPTGAPGLTINGNGNTLTLNNGGGVYGYFRIPPGTEPTLNLSDITLTGAVHFTDGGVISNNNNPGSIALNIVGPVTFSDNQGAVVGGAIYAGNVSINGSDASTISFSDNFVVSANGGGGAVSAGEPFNPNAGNVVITNGIDGVISFVNNTAGGAGGAIDAYGGAGHVSLSNGDGGTIILSGNSAISGSGGAIASMSDSGISISNGDRGVISLTGNTAGIGGALSSSDFDNEGGNVVITNGAGSTITVTNNTARNTPGTASIGGAIYSLGNIILGNGDDGIITVSGNTAVDDEESTSGGAFFSYRGVSISSGNTSTITLNGNSGGSGGAIYAGGAFDVPGDVTISNGDGGVISLTDNVANDGEGGAIFTHSQVRLDNLDNGTITVSGNTASGPGGAIYAVSIYDNTAGVIISNGNNGVITLSGNTSDDFGGVIYTNGTVDITSGDGGSISLTDNASDSSGFASAYGSAIYAQGDINIISGQESTIEVSGNTVLVAEAPFFDFGGAIYSNGTVTISNGDKSTIDLSNNYGAIFGAFINVSNGDSSAITLNNNSGSAIHGTADVDVHNGDNGRITLSGNTSNFPGGGAILSMYGGVNVSSGNGGVITLSDNEASIAYYGGGAVFANYNVILGGEGVDSISLTGNTAVGLGGAIFSFGNDPLFGSFLGEGTVRIGNPDATLVLTGNSVSANDLFAGDGGLIGTLFGGDVRVTGHGVIGSNTADGNGGAIVTVAALLSPQFLEQNFLTVEDVIFLLPAGDTVALVTSGGDLVVTDNRAGGSGGAIYADSGIEGGILLDATEGNITFSGNTQNAASTPQANAIYMNNSGGDAHLTLNAAADHAITFFDPVENNATNGLVDVIASGGGLVIFDGSLYSSLSDRWSRIYARTTVESGTTFLVRNGAIYGVLASDVGQIGQTSFMVESGGRLGGNGTVGSNVRIGNGGILEPSAFSSIPANELTINGNLVLDPGAILNYHFGEANIVAGSFNDHVLVRGDLTLGGTLNVTTTPGGSFDPGIWRVITYEGSLTNPDSTLHLGTLPTTDSYLVQTSVPGQVNLVLNIPTNLFTFWDGGNVSLHGNGIVNGGNGIWQSSAGNTNWTEVNGDSIGAWANGQFAVFEATPGTVTVDNSLGAVEASGMQFAANGYVIMGDSLTLVGDSAVIRVGNGTSSGAGYVARISSKLAGSANLVKTDRGTLVLSGANGYTGGTTVLEGTLRAGAVNTIPDTGPVAVGEAGTLELAGFNQTVASLMNAGTIRMSATPTSTPGTVLTVSGSYLGNSGVIEMNTVLGGDNSLTDRLVINGGSAGGSTTLRFTNAGGAGAQTVQGIRVVETQNGGTTTPDAFRLDGRVTAGAYEYFLKRTGQDWFLANGFRPETLEDVLIPATGRSLGLFTVRTLHERVGEEENLRGQAESRSLLNGIWARALGEHQTNSFTGAGNPSVDGNFWGGQLGLDLYRHTTDGGHRDHLGALGSYTGFRSSSVRGDALGELDIEVGEIEMKGPSAGLYWTHFGPGGWYLDAVAQESWYHVKATAQTSALSGTQLETDLKGLTASLETGYPLHLGTNGMWLVEPQAQVIWQGFDVDRYPGTSSTSSGAGILPESSPVEWNTADVWTGRLGVRIQQSCKCADGPLWQRYGRINVWHEFNGTDGIVFDGTGPVDTRFGGTSLEGGLGMTAKASQLLSVYGEATYRHSVGGGPRESTGVHGTLGARLNW
ncbi:MAG: autotransporter outer membrane beta-barrel domain-containing protein [Gemmatimonadota bacterium]|nr:autotransporter outer membrane beta-barrel domain-containing protein [Gemmatimonadota bacterium]